jgi:hypothetical protein
MHHLGCLRTVPSAGPDGLLPRVDLPDVLLEVAERTGFLTEFTYISEDAARAEDLGVSICAVLVAEACNIGLEPVVQARNPALSRARVSWVDQNYVRGDTITAATARFVDAQGDIPLAQAWGGGEVASADGLRFVVPVRTLNAGPNPRYFGPGSGVTYLNFLSDQFAGFHAIIVPGALRDSLYILDGLLVELTAYLCPDPVPLAWFTSDRLDGPLRAAVADDNLDYLVAGARRYSLVHRAGAGIQLHRLVAAVIRAHLPPQPPHRDRRPGPPTARRRPTGQ